MSDKVGRKLGYCYKCQSPIMWHVPTSERKQEGIGIDGYCETCDAIRFGIPNFSGSWLFATLLNKLTRIEEIFIRNRK